MILEAVITTEVDIGTASASRMHVAPMGPEVSLNFDSWILKPFQSSNTFRNLKSSGRCVVHVIDDSLLLAKAVLGIAHDEPATFVDGCGYVLDKATHWYALKVTNWDISQDRARAECSVVRHQSIRPFFGWNRAKHAIVELAILVSRRDRLDKAFIANEVERLRVLIEKTAGDNERSAFQLLESSLIDSVMNSTGLRGSDS